MLGLLKIVLSKVQRAYYQFSLTLTLDVGFRIQFEVFHPEVLQYTNK